jgi:hypothetical protein
MYWNPNGMNFLGRSGSGDGGKGVHLVAMLWNLVAVGGLEFLDLDPCIRSWRTTENKAR